jgi:glycosyltransferase involved in cell wall biosynthesis
MPSRQTLAFVAHLPLQPSGGGVYAVNWRVYHALQAYFDLAPFSPIVPPVDYVKRIWSKFKRRVLKRPANFSQFSKFALDRTAVMVARQTQSNVSALFFRSSTRWIHCKPAVPYFVHTDAVFHTFFRNTFRDGDFHPRDLDRIYETEKRFLEAASGVFFESEWGLQKACDAYGLSRKNLVSLGIGGGIAPPGEDLWDRRSLNLVTIAKNFRQKGGDIVLAAFQRLKPRYPDLRWHIVGGSPEGDCKSVGGIQYEGHLRPDVPDELTRFRDILGNAFLLVHPTREDVNPLVLIEAAYFGCPTVSVNDFAIPELVANQQTGLLLDRPVTPETVANAIEVLINNRQRYLEMRSQSRRRAIELFSWQKIGDRMAGIIQDSLARGGIQ